MKDAEKRIWLTMEFGGRIGSTGLTYEEALEDQKRRTVGTAFFLVWREDEIYDIPNEDRPRPPGSPAEIRKREFDAWWERIFGPLDDDPPDDTEDTAQ